MNIFQRIGTAIKSFIGKRVTGSTTKSRINRAIRGYVKTQTTRMKSLSNATTDVNKYYTEKLSNDIGKQIDNANRFIELKKYKHLRTLTEKELKLFENIYSVNIKDSAGIDNLKVYDEMSSFKQMLLTTLKEKGVDIYDPRAL